MQIRALSVLLVLITTYACSSSTQQISNVDTLRESLQQQPEHWPTRLQLAESLRQDQRYKEAIRLLDPASLHNRKSLVPTEGHILLATIYLDSSRYRQAQEVLLEHFEKATDLKTTTKDEIGLLFLNLTQSILAYKGAENLKPLVRPLLEQAAHLHLIQPKRNEWLKAFMPHIRTLSESGYDGEVVALGNQLLVDEMESSPAHFEIGICALARPSSQRAANPVVAKALSKFLDASANPEDRTEKELETARRFSQKFAARRALTHLNKALELQPSLRAAKLLQIKMLLQINHAQAARDALPAYLESFTKGPQQIEALSTLIPVLVRFNKHADAINLAIDEASKSNFTKNPEHLLSALRLAVTAAKSKKDRAQISDYLDSLVQSANKPDYRHALAKLYMRLNAYDQAQKILTKDCFGVVDTITLTCLSLATNQKKKQQVRALTKHLMRADSNTMIASDALVILSSAGFNKMAQKLSSKLIKRPDAPWQLYRDELARLIDSGKSDVLLDTFLTRHSHSLTTSQSRQVIALLLEQNKQPSLASKWYRKAADVAEEDMVRNHNLLSALRIEEQTRTTNTARVARELQSILSSGTKDPDLLQGILDLCNHNNQLKGVKREVLSKIAQTQGLISSGYMELATLWLESDTPAQAADALKNALKGASQPRRTMEEIITLFQRKGHIKVFIQVFQNTRPEIRESKALIMRAASLLTRRADEEDARILYEMAIQSAQNNPKLLRQIGTSLEARGILGLALTSFHRADELERDLPTLKSIVRLKLKIKKPHQAYGYATEYAKLNPSPFNAWTELGQLFTRQFFFKKAIDCYMQAFALKAKAPPKPLLRKLIHLQSRFGQKKSLLPLIQQLIPSSMIHLASDQDLRVVSETLRATGNVEEALLYELTRIQTREKGAEHWLYIAQLYLEQGDEEKALSSYMKAIQTSPKAEHEALAQQIEVDLTEQKKPSLILQIADALMRSQPKMLTPYTMKARVHFVEGTSSTGHATMLKSLNLMVQPEKDWPRISRAYNEETPTKLRIEFVSKALTLFPGTPAIARELGLLFLTEGMTAEAVEAFSHIQRTQPDQAYHLGRILEQNGNLSQALPFYKASALQVQESDAKNILPDYLRLTRTLFGSKATRKALGEIISANPKKGWLLKAASLALIEAGMLPDANKLLKKFVASNNIDESEKLMGVISYWSGDKKRANRHFERYAKPDSTKVHSGRSEASAKTIDRFLEIADFLSNEGNFEGAFTWARRCHEIPGGRVKSLISEAFHALRGSYYERASQAFAAAIKENPSRALMNSEGLLELAIRTHKACMFLPAVALLPKDLGPIGAYTQYRLSLRCDEPSEEAFANLLLMADAGIPELPAFAAFEAIRAGHYEEAEQLLTPYIQKFGARVLDQDGKSGSDSLNNLITAIQMQTHENRSAEQNQRKIEALLDLLWRDAQQPLRTLEKLSKLLGSSFGYWDLAARYSEQLLVIKKHDPKAWTNRVDIALQRSHEDLFAVLQRLKESVGPSKRSYQRIRNVFHQTGELEQLAKAEKILEIDSEKKLIPRIYAEYLDSFYRLDLPRTKELADHLIRESKNSLLYYRKVISLAVTSGWYAEAHRLLKGAREAFPNDPQLFWWSTELRLNNPAKRSPSILALAEWVNKHGLQPVNQRLSGSPNLIDLYRSLNEDEFESVLSPILSNKKNTEQPLAKALLGLKQKDEKSVVKAIGQIDKNGIHAERYLFLLFPHLVRAHFVHASLELAGLVRKWTGLLPSSKRLCFELETMLVNTHLNDPLRRTIGAVGLKLLENYLQVANDKVGATTNLASFRSAIGDFDGAVKAYEDLIQGLPGMASVRNNLAYHYANRGTGTEKGLSLVNSALRLEPSAGPFYLDTRGWINFQKGAYDDAYDDVLGSIRTGARLRNFMSEESQIHAAEIALKKKDLKLAQKHALRALVIAPEGAITKRARQILKGVFPSQ